VDTSVKVTLTVLAETQKLPRSAPPEPELPAARAGQGSQHRAIELRRCLHHGTQAGDALVPLAKLDQAIAEVEPRAQEIGLARQHQSEPLGRAQELALVLE